MVDTVKIYRVECPETGKGMYKFMSPYGRRGVNHPSAVCPTPGSDSKLVAFLSEIYCIYYKNGYKDKYYDDFYEYGAKLLNVGPKIGREEVNCPWNFPSTNSYCDTDSPWHFGFADMNQMMAWLSDESIENAHKKGLVLSIYEVHETAAGIGDTQAVFFRPCARIIERRSLKSLLTPKPEPVKKVPTKAEIDASVENIISRIAETSIFSGYGSSGVFYGPDSKVYEKPLRYEFFSQAREIRGIGKFKSIP